MDLTQEQLRDCTQCSLVNAREWLPHVNEALHLFDIATPVRAAAFLAQIAHESGRLVYTSELWGPTAAQVRYEGRADLGNTKPGDGSRFRGHGLIQTTGRKNHASTRDGLRSLQFGLTVVPDFEASPEALALPRWAALSAGWYWWERKLNALADSQQFDAITRKINGGTNGADDRRTLYRLAWNALGAGA
jgi:putative chitinase